MLNSFKSFFKKYFITKAEFQKEIHLLQKEIQANRFLLGQIKVQQIKELCNNISSIQEAEFQVFSQFGDDGIIQYLIQQIPINQQVFIEFGVERYTESNTRFLLMNNNWSGLVIDGDEKNINFIQQDEIYWRYDLTAVCSFITAENINQIFVNHGFVGEIGLLSIDIDGNDYWVWKQIASVNPVIVIVEYNSVFGLLPITIPYQADFVRTKAHFSNLYWGTSLGALYHLAEEKGYYFVGTNSAGNNAYFIRKDKLKLDAVPNLTPLTLERGFTESKFRESRNQQNELTFLRGKNRLKAIEDCEVYHVLENKIFKIKELI
ncbi:hypothetical protein [Thermoflexibacter ruber]|uniref:Uncharacterized protein n=1 Tax=Thermoflexibacter ruber TaxID=1003 RepID=A0A1I2GV56_9BACT|nr:hypothetical protein [Thermoflexibacter ruber]SFF20506.1 hypothetical protein SAMN04488541_10209 [Thermoflexibacter ruber]